MTETEATHQVIEARNRLAEKADPSGGPSAEEIEAALAESLAGLAEEYPGEVRRVCAGLRGLLGELRSAAEPAASVRAVHPPFHDLKGQAATLGFPLIGEAAAAMCELVIRHPEVAASHPGLLEVYVDAIDLMAAELIRDRADRRGALLGAELETALRKTLQSAR